MHISPNAYDYSRDEVFQREYAATAKGDEAWEGFRARYVDVSEAEYQKAVKWAPVP